MAVGFCFLRTRAETNGDELKFYVQLILYNTKKKIAKTEICVAELCITLIIKTDKVPKEIANVELFTGFNKIIKNTLLIENVIQFIARIR